MRKPRKKTIKSPIVWLEIKNQLGPSSLKAKVTDINTAGIGLRIDAPLETGQFVKFVKKQKHLEGELPQEGVVVWTLESPEGYKAGVKFV